MLIQLCWLASEARGSSCLHPSSGGVRDTTNLLGFLLRSGDPNSGPCVCIAGMLLTWFCPQPTVSFLMFWSGGH